jgi:hypothetical protein
MVWSVYTVYSYISYQRNRNEEFSTVLNPDFTYIHPGLLGLVFSSFDSESKHRNSTGFSPSLLRRSEI